MFSFFNSSTCWFVIVLLIINYIVFTLLWIAPMGVFIINYTVFTLFWIAPKGVFIGVEENWKSDDLNSFNRRLGTHLENEASGFKWHLVMCLFCYQKNLLIPAESHIDRLNKSPHLTPNCQTITTDKNMILNWSCYCASCALGDGGRSEHVTRGIVLL